MKQTPRQWLVWAALTMTLAATAWTALNGEQADEVQVAAARPQGSRNDVKGPSKSRTATADVKPAGADSLDMARLRRAPWQDSEHNLFGGGQLVAQAETIQQPIVQQAMEIPPLPFTYAGKLEDHGQFTVFLSLGEKNVSVKTGDIVGDWKVKEITPSRMILSYQPLRADVPLMIGESN